MLHHFLSRLWWSVIEQQPRASLTNSMAMWHSNLAESCRSSHISACRNLFPSSLRERTRVRGWSYGDRGRKTLYCGNTNQLLTSACLRLEAERTLPGSAPRLDC